MDFIECENPTIAMAPEGSQKDADLNRSENQDVDQTPAIFPCISCDSIFFNREECREHMREHARRKTLKCRYCNEQQGSMKQLLHHLKTHRGESSVCIAARGFKSGGVIQLAMLKSTHSPKKRKQNPANGFESETQTSDTVIDRTVMKRKTASRGRKKGSYVYSRTCTDCGELFLSTTTLKNHKKLHNAGKLLYSCSYCSYRSDFPAAIEKHLKKKHENLKMLYKCALCKFVAIRISLLKTHVTLNQHFET